MRQGIAAAVAAMLAAGVASAQPGPSQAALDDAVQLGTVAALAPLCGLREEDWSFDLRRATILGATGDGKADDRALAEAPGSNLVIGALSFAEAEALESFAEAAPVTSCNALAGSEDLSRADALVAAFRARKTGS